MTVTRKACFKAIVAISFFVSESSHLARRMRSSMTYCAGVVPNDLRKANRKSWVVM